MSALGTCYVKMKRERMPPYFSIDFELKNDSKTKDYFENVYKCLFSLGFSFKSVFDWGCSSDLTWNDIQEWNIQKLLEGYTLGFTDDISLNYRQFFMEHPKFEYIRVMTMNNESPELAIIIPESEIFDENLKYKEDLIETLIEYCTYIWESGLVRTIQSHNENGNLVNCSDILSGEKPCAFPFAFIELDCLTPNQFEGVSISSLNNGYFLRKA